MPAHATLNPSIEEVATTLATLPRSALAGFFKALSLFWTRERVAVLLTVYTAMLIETGQEDVEDIVSEAFATLQPKGQNNDERYDYGESQVENPTD